jgi:hypothetical protein
LLSKSHRFKRRDADFAVQIRPDECIGDFALVEASRKLRNRKVAFSRSVSVESLLSRPNGKLQVRRVFAARVDNVLPTVGADVLVDPRH